MMTTNQKIKRFLKEKKQATVHEIAAELGMLRHSVAGALSRMKANNEINRVAPATYSLDMSVESPPHYYIRVLTALEGKTVVTMTQICELTGMTREQCSSCITQIRRMGLTVLSTCTDDDTYYLLHEVR